MKLTLFVITGLVVIATSTAIVTGIYRNKSFSATVGARIYRNHLVD